MQNFIIRPYRAFFVKASLALLIWTLTGCSALRFGYGNADSFAFWWLNGYVDFNEDQKPWVKKDIENLLAWHRKTQLNDYAELLTQAQQRLLKQKITPTDAMADYAALKTRAQLMVDKSLPELTSLALTLQPQQITHIEKKFASTNTSYRKDYLRGNLEERQLFRFKKVMQQAEFWFGDFSADQEAHIRAASDARPLNNELWMAERLQRQQTLIQILKKIQAEQPARDAALAMLTTYAADSFTHFTYAEHGTFFDASRDGMMQMVVLIINMATPAQKAHAAKKLQGWIDDCNALAGH